MHERGKYPQLCRNRVQPQYAGVGMVAGTHQTDINQTPVTPTTRLYVVAGSTTHSTSQTPTS